MKKFIHLNLKRFDVLDKLGGVNHQGDVFNWGEYITSEIDEYTKNVSQEYDVEFTAYFPETHLISATKGLSKDSQLSVGCQSVYRKDVEIGGNFGAFTTHRPASAMSQLGINHTIIGHFEERLDKNEMYELVGVNDSQIVNKLLNQEIKTAQKRGMKVLYCIGESLEQKDNWQIVLKEQLEIGLANIDLSDVAIAYEPVWAIGPGKTPPTAEQIKEISDYIKTLYPNTPLLYGGGLKKENAAEIANIDSLDGGLIALTRFSGKIGFYPDEYKEIVEAYLGIKDEVLV